MARILGSILGATMQVTHIITGHVRPGERIVGPGVEDGTMIVGQLSGKAGDLGFYRVRPQQLVSNVLMRTSKRRATH